MINKGLFSSNSDEWETPLDLFFDLNFFFHFDLDPCASHSNHKCDNYFTKDDDGLKKSWSGHTVFVNPPYGREISKWVKKAYYESLNGTTIVMLLPARTDTLWFHNYIYHKSKITFLKGRLHFNNSKNSAPFPSMLVFYNGGF